MSTTRPTEFRAVVDVRVPCDGGDDLATATSHRLERQSAVESVAITELQGLQPALSATVVSVVVRVRVHGDGDRSTVRQHLESAPGVQRVAGVQSAEP